MSQGMESAEKSAGLAIASMVLGIVSLVLFCLWYVSVPCAIIAVVLGLVARGKVKDGTGGGGGMAMAGIVCGAIAILLVLLLFAGLLAFLNFAGPEMMEDFQEQMKEMEREMEIERPQNPVEGGGPALEPPANPDE
ncbi:MAG: DUF4190 domain-containing protein [Aeoliella sp.]